MTRRLTVQRPLITTLTRQRCSKCPLVWPLAWISGWTVRPHADLTVIPQFGDTEQDIKVKNGEFTDAVNGDVAGNFATKATFGLQAMKNNTTVGARYGFTVGDMGRQDHALKVEVRYAF